MREFGEKAAGLATLRQALDRSPQHAKSREAVEALLDDNALFDDVFDTLELVYDTLGSSRDLASLYRRRVDRATCRRTHARTARFWLASSNNGSGIRFRPRAFWRRRSSKIRRATRVWLNWSAWRESRSHGAMPPTPSRRRWRPIQRSLRRLARSAGRDSQTGGVNISPTFVRPRTRTFERWLSTPKTWTSSGVSRPSGAFQGASATCSVSFVRALV